MLELVRSLQVRGAGEPSLIAGIAPTILRDHSADPARSHSGISAGGSTAIVAATAYPDLFAVAGVHSGLPAGATNNAASVFLAMRQGAPGDRPTVAMPTIVFHGDADAVVHPRNGRFVVARSLAAHPRLKKVERKGAAGPHRPQRRARRAAEGRALGLAPERWHPARRPRAAAHCGADPVLRLGRLADENVRDARAMAQMFEALERMPAPADRPDPRRGARRRRRPGRGLRHRRRAEDAQFGFTEVKLGILPAVISPYRDREDRALRGARAVPDRRALLRRRARSEIGLVHAVVPTRPTSTRRSTRRQRTPDVRAPRRLPRAKKLIARGRGARAADAIRYYDRRDRRAARVGGRPGGHARVSREAQAPLDAQ